MLARPLLFFAAVVLSVSACAAPTELAGADLPLAETPAGVQQVTWGLPFEATFAAGYWSEGAHRYRFVIDCPPIEAELESAAIEFRVTRLTRTVPGRIYLRMGGLSDGIMMPSNVGAIHPDQPTTAVVTFLGLSDSAIDQASASCEGTMEFDGDQAEVLVPGAPFRP